MNLRKLNHVIADDLAWPLKVISASHWKPLYGPIISKNTIKQEDVMDEQPFTAVVSKLTSISRLLAVTYVVAYT